MDAFRTFGSGKSGLGYRPPVNSTWMKMVLDGLGAESGETSTCNGLAMPVAKRCNTPQLCEVQVTVLPPSTCDADSPSVRV